MSKAIIPYQLDRKLPFAITNQLRQLPEDVQKDFLREYRKRSKDLAVAYLLQWLSPFGFHYLYTNKIILFIFYTLTFMGGGIWFLIDLIRMPSMIRAVNDRIADECLREVMYRHQVHAGKGRTPNYLSKLHVNEPLRQIEARQPRTLQLEDDPLNLQIENLKIGYLVDYGLKTWEVKNENQYDWDSGLVEREFVLKNDTQRQFLSVWYQHGTWNTQVAEEINLHSIREDLDKEILQNQNPPTILHYGDLKFYREDFREGFVFDKSNRNLKGNKVLAWDYYDQTRQKIVRIEQSGRKKFRAKLGFVVDSSLFSEVLPYGDEI